MTTTGLGLTTSFTGLPSGEGYIDALPKASLEKTPSSEANSSEGVAIKMTEAATGALRKTQSSGDLKNKTISKKHSTHPPGDFYLEPIHDQHTGLSMALYSPANAEGERKNLWNDQKVLSQLTSFLENERNPEIMEFLRDCITLFPSPSKMTKVDDLRDIELKSDFLYKKFLVESGGKQINVEKKVLRQFEETRRNINSEVLNGTTVFMGIEHIRAIHNMMNEVCMPLNHAYLVKNRACHVALTESLTTPPSSPQSSSLRRLFQKKS